MASSLARYRDTAIEDNDTAVHQLRNSCPKPLSLALAFFSKLRHWWTSGQKVHVENAQPGNHQMGFQRTVGDAAADGYTGTGTDTQVQPKESTIGIKVIYVNEAYRRSSGSSSESEFGPLRQILATKEHENGLGAAKDNNDADADRDDYADANADVNADVVAEVNSDDDYADAETGANANADADAEANSDDDDYADATADAGAAVDANANAVAESDSDDNDYADAIADADANEQMMKPPAAREEPDGATILGNSREVYVKRPLFNACEPVLPLSIREIVENGQGSADVVEVKEDGAKGEAEEEEEEEMDQLSDETVTAPRDSESLHRFGSETTLRFERMSAENIVLLENVISQAHGPIIGNVDYRTLMNNVDVCFRLRGMLSTWSRAIEMPIYVPTVSTIVSYTPLRGRSYEVDLSAAPTLNEMLRFQALIGSHELYHAETILHVLMLRYLRMVRPRNLLLNRLRLFDRHLFTLLAIFGSLTLVLVYYIIYMEWKMNLFLLANKKRFYFF